MWLEANEENAREIRKAIRSGSTVEDAVKATGGSGHPLECEEILRQMEACFGMGPASRREMARSRPIPRDCPYCKGKVINNKCKGCHMSPCRARSYMTSQLKPKE
jgi:hypothetical protein